jgi:hypothetical protein
MRIYSVHPITVNMHAAASAHAVRLCIHTANVQHAAQVLNSVPSQSTVYANLKQILILLAQY